MRDVAHDFLDRAGWSPSATEPVAGDLSARSYVRVSKGGGTAILMDANNDSGSTKAFVKITDWLLGIGLSAPRILFAQPEDGLLLLEDFGTQHVSRRLADDHACESIYGLCIDLLLTIRQARPPALAAPTALQLCDWTRLTDAHYPGINIEAMQAFRAELETVLSALLGSPPSLSLRDFHVDNMMWLAQRRGVNQIGLLDYQDAFLTHPVYDLVSLLTDARTDVPRQRRQRFIAAYAAASGDDPKDLGAAFAAFSVQRNLRILGIFHKAAKVDGKAQYLPRVPRVYGYLTEALEHPVFDKSRDLILKALPRPAGAA